MAMFNLRVLSRGFTRITVNKHIPNVRLYSAYEKFNAYFGHKSFRKGPVKLLVTAVPVTALGAGYYFYGSKKENDDFLNEFDIRNVEYQLLESKPNVPIARTVNKSKDDLNLNLTLFQYPTCPFCCKVRAFLDYYGIPYDVVEVNPVFRQQTSWTTYKKVPILLAKVKDGYQQLNDSSMIVSALKTYLVNQNISLEEIVNYYPMIEFKEKEGKVKSDVLNKYFLMFQENVPKNKTTEVVKEEKHWREWADNELVHTLSPNVYRTADEALQAFRWFSEVGEWDKLFSAWERFVIVYVGAFAMWLISKNLKKRHNLKDDVRESLYDSCRKWMKLLSIKNTQFLGGSTPNLGDLAVYGVLSSIEGCIAFNDLLNNTNIGKWYYPVKEAVNNHKGRHEIFPMSTSK